MKLSPPLFFCLGNILNLFYFILFPGYLYQIWLLKLCPSNVVSSKELGPPTKNHVSSFASKNLVHSLTGHHDAILSMAVHKDALFSGSADCDIRGWDTDDGTCLARCEGHKLAVVTLAANGDYLISGGSDSIIQQWNVKLGWGREGNLLCLNVSEN